MRRRRYLMGIGTGIAIGGAVSTATASEHLDVEIYGSNDPVAGGDSLEVYARVHNDGNEDRTVEVELVVGDEVVDGATRTVPAGGYSSLGLGFETYDIQQDVTFPATVRADGVDDSREVTVLAADGASAGFAVEIVGTEDPVRGGEWLSVFADVENVGDVYGEQTVELVVDGEVVDSESVALTVGESTGVRLGWETYEIQRDVEFPVTVRSEDDSDEQVVEVLAAGGGEAVFGVDIEGTNSPVEGTERLEVYAPITNNGDATGTQEVRLVAGGEVVDAESVTVAPGEVTGATLGFRTYDTQQDVEFPVTVESEDDSVSVTVEVYAR